MVKAAGKSVLRKTCKQLGLDEDGTLQQMEARLAFLDDGSISSNTDVATEVLGEKKPLEQGNLAPKSKVRATPVKGGKENAKVNLDDAMLTDLANQAAPTFVAKK